MEAVLRKFDRARHLPENRWSIEADGSTACCAVQLSRGHGRKAKGSESICDGNRADGSLGTAGPVRRSAAGRVDRSAHNFEQPRGCAARKQECHPRGISLFWREAWGPRRARRPYDNGPRQGRTRTTSPIRRVPAGHRWHGTRWARARPRGGRRQSHTSTTTPNIDCASR